MPFMPCLSGMVLQPLATELTTPGSSIHPTPSDRLLLPMCVFCLHVLCCVACSQLNVTYCCTSKNNNRKHRSIFECWAACNDVGCVDCSLLSGEYEPEMVVTCPDELNTAFLLALSCLPHLLPHILKENSFLLSVSAATPLKS